MNRWDIAKTESEILNNSIPIYRDLYEFNQGVQISLENRRFLDELSLEIYSTEILNYRLKELNYRAFIENGGILPKNIFI